MKGKNLIKKLVIDRLESTTAKDVIREMVTGLFDRGYLPGDISVDRVVQEILSREDGQTTGLGHGLAFPHARIKDWSGEFVMVVGFSSRGINFSSVDGRPVYAVFMMISSMAEPYAVLQTMSSVARALNGLELGEGHTVPEEKILDLISGIGKKSGELLCASDIMIPVRDVVTPDASIEEVAHLMHVKQLDVVPVVDEHKCYCGEISSLTIFRIGMPEFFKNLPTISFVRHIDPFEKYFHVKGDLKAGDIMDINEQLFTRDKTLLEIIFELTVKKRQRIFILDDQKHLEGMIDRFCILDKILFF